VAVAFFAFEWVMHTQQIIVRRDPASYFQFSTWLTKHGSLPIPQDHAAFGNDKNVGHESAAFYPNGTALVPQFMAGMPMLMTLGGWFFGYGGQLVMAPLMGAAATLTFGGLVARLASARWAWVAALALALTVPMLMVSRSSYSEPPAMVLLLGGLALAVAAIHETGLPRPDRIRLAFLGGLCLGLTALIRIDGISDILPAFAFCGLMFALRKPGSLALWIGLVLGQALGVLEGGVLSLPYMKYLKGSLIPLTAICVAVALATFAMVIVVRLWGLPKLNRFHLPEIAAGLTILVMAGFAARPLFQTVRRIPTNINDKGNAQFIQAVQRIDGLPLDGTRQYSELSLHWVAWYIGIPAVVLATVGAALILRGLLARKPLGGRSLTSWALPFAVVAWTTLTVLYSPAITPDQPWGSRRLIAAVIPGLLLFAVWTLDWGVTAVRRVGYGRIVTAGLAAVGVLFMIVPPVMTSRSTMFIKTEQGEVGQAQRMCDAIGPNASVVFVDLNAAGQFAELVRGMCGVPTGWLNQPGNVADVRRITQEIEKAGRRPVLLSGSYRVASMYGTAKRVFYVNTRQDQRTLVTPPDSSWRFVSSVYLINPTG
jgi:hypothetical protein